MNGTNPITIESNPPLSVVIPLMLSCVIAVVFNAIVCYLIYTVRRLKTPTNVFVFSLCVCNISFAGLLLPLYCFYQNSLFYMYVVLSTVLIYFGNLTAVTYERLFSITRPMQYNQEMNKRKAIKMVIMAWSIPLIYCFLPNIWKSNTTILPHKIFLSGTLVLFLLLPLVYILYVYVRVCIEIKKMLNYSSKASHGNRKKKQSSKFGKHKKDNKLEIATNKTINEFSFKSDESSMSMSVDSGTSRQLNLHTEVSGTSSLLLTDDNSSQNKQLTENLKHSDECKNKNDQSCDKKVKKKKGKTRFFGKKLSDKNGTQLVVVMEGTPNGRQSVVITTDTPKDDSRRHEARSKKIKAKIREVKASLAFGIVTFKYMFTWLPVVAMTIHLIIDRPDLTPPSLAVFSIFTIAFNALSDPFLYGLLLQDYRKTIREKIRRFRSGL